MCRVLGFEVVFSQVGKESRIKNQEFKKGSGAADRPDGLDGAAYRGRFRPGIGQTGLARKLARRAR